MSATAVDEPLSFVTNASVWPPFVSWKGLAVGKFVELVQPVR